MKTTSNSHFKTGFVNKYHYYATVFETLSEYGINNGRVSKLSIRKVYKNTANSTYTEKEIYNYDRGLDFNNCPNNILNKIIAIVTK